LYLLTAYASNFQKINDISLTNRPVIGYDPDFLKPGQKIARFSSSQANQRLFLVSPLGVLMRLVYLIT
jgi:hypothetical protein